MWGVFSGKKSDVSTRSSANRKKSTTSGSSSKSKRDSKSSRRSASGRTSTTRSVKDDSDSDSDDDDKPRDGSPVRASSERSSRSKRDRDSKRSSSKSSSKYRDLKNDDDDAQTAVSSVYYDANDKNASTVTPQSSTRYREPKDSRESATPSRSSARTRDVDEYQTTPSKYQDTRSSRDSTTPLRSSTKSRGIDAYEDISSGYQNSRTPRDPITPSRSSTRTRGADEYDSGPSKYWDTQDYTTPRSSTSTRGVGDYQAPSSSSSKYEPTPESKNANRSTRAPDDNVSGTYAPQTSQYSTSQQTSSSQVYNSTTSQQKLSTSYNSSDSPATAQQKYDFQSTIPNQFPGQVPNEYSAPFRPPGSPPADFSYGAAASYYGDHGESVSFQPGVRPGTPMIVGSETHLRPALPNSNPPSETGEGAAADYYNESFQVSNKPTSQASSTTIKPMKQSSNSSYNQSMMTTAAATAAGGLYSTSQSYNTSTTPDKPPKFSAGQSNIPMVAAGLAGAVGLGAAAWKRKHDQKIHTTEQHSSSSTVSVGTRPRPNRHSSSMAHANRLSASTSGELQHSQQTTSTMMETDSKYDFRENIHAREREQRGPLGRLVDWWADYEDIRRMEEYTEYIGICKYCFDPRSTARDAPRKHHFRRRPSREFRRDRTRIDKDSRYASESDSRRKSRRTGSSLGTAAALAGGVGLAAAARRGHREARRGQERLDDGQVRVGHRESESRRQRSDSLERRSSGSRGVVHRDNHGSLYMTRESDGKRVESSHRSRRSRSRSHSHSPSRRTGEAALLGAGAATIAGIGVEEVLKHRKKTGRSDDIGVERRHSRISSSSSSSESEVGFFASIFSPKSKKRAKEKAKAKRKESFYSQAVASASSTSSVDSHLAYGTLRRRSSRSKVRSRSSTKRQSLSKVSGKTGRVLPGMAAAAALVTAVEEVKRNQRKANSAKLVAVREKKIPDRPPTSQRFNQGVTGVMEEGDWESASEDEYSSSNDSALAFGYDHQARRLARKSHESLSSVSSGGDKWSWRWGSKKEKDKKRRKRRDSVSDTELKRINSTTLPPPPAADPTPYIPTDYTARERRQSSASGWLSQAPMQYVDPMPVGESVVADRYTESPRRITTESVVLQQPQPISPVKTSKYDAKIANGNYKASSSRRDSEDPAIYQRLKRVESLPIEEQDAPTGYGLRRRRTEPTMSGALRDSDLTSRTESPREKRGSALRKVAEDVAIAGAVAGVGGLVYTTTHQDSDENAKSRRRSSSVRFAANDHKEELRRHRSRQSNFSEPLREESESGSPPRSRRLSKIESVEGPVSMSKNGSSEKESPSVSEYATQPYFDPSNQRFTSQPRFESTTTAYAIPGSFEPPTAESNLPVNSEPTTTSYVAPSRYDYVSPSSAKKPNVWDYEVGGREPYTIPSETRRLDTTDNKEEVEQSTSDIPTFFTPAAAAMAMGPLMSQLNKTKEPEKEDQYSEEQKTDAIWSPPAVEAENARSRATNEYHVRHYTGDARQSDEPIFDEDLNDPHFFKKKKKSKSERESRRQSRTAAELKNEFRNRSSSPAVKEESTAEEVFAAFEDKYKDATVSQADFFKPADLDSDKKVIDDRVNADFDFEHQSGRSRSDSWVAKGLPWPIPRLNVVPATPPLSITGSVNGDASRDVSPNRGSTTAAAQKSEGTAEREIEQPRTTDIEPDSKADGSQDSHSAIQVDTSADREVDPAPQTGSEVQTEPVPSTYPATDSTSTPGDMAKTSKNVTINGTKKKSKWASILGGFTAKPTQATSVQNAVEAFQEAPFNQENDIISGYEKDADEPEVPLQKVEPPSEEESTSMKSVVDAFDNARYSKENDIISGYGENGEGESLERQSTRTSQVSRGGKGEKSPSFTAALAAFGAGAAMSSASNSEKGRTSVSQSDVRESDPEPEAKQDSPKMPGGFGSDDEDVKSVNLIRSASRDADVTAPELDRHHAPQSEMSQDYAPVTEVIAEPSRDFSNSGRVPKSTYDITDGEEQIWDQTGDLESSKYVSRTNNVPHADTSPLEKNSSEVSREYNSSNYVPARSTDDDSFNSLSRQSTRDFNSKDSHDTYTNGKEDDTYSSRKSIQEDEPRELNENDEDYKYTPSRRPKSEPDYSDYATLSRSNSRASEPSSRRTKGKESRGKKSSSNGRRQSGHGEDFTSADIPDTASVVTAPPAVGTDDFETSGEKRRKRKSKRRSTQDGLDNDVEDDSLSKVSTSRSEADLSRYARDEGAGGRLKKDLDLESSDNNSILTTPQPHIESIGTMRAVLGSTPGPEDFQPAKLPSTASYADKRRSMEITSPTRPLFRRRSSMTVIDRPELWEVIPEMIRLPDSRPESPYDEEQSVNRGALSPPPSTQPAPVRTPSSTAVPFRFRRPPPSPGTPTSPSASGSIVDIPVPQKTRQNRPQSKEMKTTEFRPLYLVETNRKTPEPDVELPSLPSSRTTSRAASVHETDDDYESAFESPPRKRERLPAFDFSFTPKRESQQDEIGDLLDSQQTTPRAPTFSSDIFGDDKGSKSPTAEESEESANSTKEDMPSIDGERTALSLAAAGVGAGLGAAWLARELQENVARKEARKVKDEPFLPLTSKGIDHDEEADVDDSFHDVEEYRSPSEDDAHVAASVPISISDSEKDGEDELKQATSSSPTKESTLREEDIEKYDIVTDVSPPANGATIEALESSDSIFDAKDQLATPSVQKDKEESRVEESRKIEIPIENDDQVIASTNISLPQKESAEMQQDEHDKRLMDPTNLTLSPQTIVDEPLAKGLLEPIELTSALRTSVEEAPDEWTSSSVAKKGKKSKRKGEGRKSKQEETEGEVDIAQPELDLEPEREPEPKPERESGPEPDREIDRAVTDSLSDSVKADETVESTQPAFEMTADQWVRPSTDNKGKKGKRKKSKQLSFDDITPVNLPAETFEPEMDSSEATASKITTALPEVEKTEGAVLELTESTPDIFEDWATPASSKKGKKGKSKKLKQFVFEEDELDKSLPESCELESKPEISERNTSTIPDKSEETAPAVLGLTEPDPDIKEDWKMPSIGEEELKSEGLKPEEPSFGDAIPMEPYVENRQLEVDAEKSTSREPERSLPELEEQVTKPVELTEPVVQHDDETAWESSTTKKGKKGKKKKTKEFSMDDAESTPTISEAELPPKRNETSREPEEFTVQPIELTEPVTQPREDEDEWAVPVAGKKAKKRKGKNSRQSTLETDASLQTAPESPIPETIQAVDQGQILPIEQETEPEFTSESAIALSEEPKELVPEQLELTETSQNNDDDWPSFSNSKKGRKGKGKKSKQRSFDDGAPTSTAIEEIPKSDQLANEAETFRMPREVDRQEQFVTSVELADPTDPQSGVAASSTAKAEREGEEETPSKSIIEDNEITSITAESDPKTRETDTEQPAGEEKKSLSALGPVEVADSTDAEKPIAQLDETTQPALIEDEWAIPSSIKKNKKGKGKKSKSVSFEDEISASTPTSSTPDSHELGLERVDEPLPIDSTATGESERYTDEPRELTSPSFQDKLNEPLEEEWSIPTSSSGKKGKKGKNKKTSTSSTSILATGAALASGAALATSLYNSKNRDEERERGQEQENEYEHEREHEFEALADRQDEYESTISTIETEGRKKHSKRDSQSYDLSEPNLLVERSSESEELPKQDKHDSSTTEIDTPAEPEVETSVEQMDRPPVNDLEDEWNESLSSKKGKKKRKGKKAKFEDTPEPDTSAITDIADSDSRGVTQFPTDLDDEDSKRQEVAAMTDPINLQSVTEVQQGDSVTSGPMEIAQDTDIDPLSEPQQPKSMTEKRELEGSDLAQEKIEQDSDWASVPIKTSSKKGKKGKGRKASLLQELPDPSESSTPTPDIVETATLEPLAAERDERQLDSELPALEVSGSTAPEEDEWTTAIQTGKKARKGKKGKGKKLVSESDKDLQPVGNLPKTTDTTSGEIETQEEIMTELYDNSEADVADTSKDTESAVVDLSIEQESDTLETLTKDDTLELTPLTGLSKKEKKARRGKGRGKGLPTSELEEPEFENDVKAEVNSGFERRPEEAPEIAETTGADLLVESDTEMHDALEVPRSADFVSDTEVHMQDAEKVINTVDFEPIENSSFDNEDTTPEVVDNTSDEKAVSDFSSAQNYAHNLSETVEKTDLEPLNDSKVKEVKETPSVDFFADTNSSQQEEDISQSDIVPEIAQTTKLEPLVEATPQQNLGTETQSGAPDDEWAIPTTSSKSKKNKKKGKKARSESIEAPEIKVDDEANDPSTSDERLQVEELPQIAEMGDEQREVMVPEIAESAVLEPFAESGPEPEIKPESEMVQQQQDNELNESDDWKSYISTGKKNKGKKGKRSKATVTEEFKGGEDSSSRDLATDIAESPSAEQLLQDPEQLEHEQSTPDDWTTTTEATSKKGKKSKGKGKKSKGQSFEFEPESRPAREGDVAEQIMEAVRDDSERIEELHQDHPEVAQAADSERPVTPHEIVEKVSEEIPEIVNETALEPFQTTDTGERKEISETPHIESPRDLETNEELQEISNEQRREDEDDEWANTITKKKGKKSKGKKSRSQSSDFKNDLDKTNTSDIDASDVRSSEVLPEAEQTIETPVQEALQADQSSEVNFAISSGEASLEQVSKEDHDDWSLPSRQKGRKSKGKKSKSQPTQSDLFVEDRESTITDVPELIETTGTSSLPEAERSVEPFEEELPEATAQSSQIQTLPGDDQTTGNQASEENEEWSVPVKQKNKKGKGKKNRSQSTDQSALTFGLPEISTAVAAATAATAGLVASEFGPHDNDDGNTDDYESSAAILTEKGDVDSVSSKLESLATEADEQLPLTTSETENSNIEKDNDREITPERLPLDSKHLEEPSRLEITTDQDDPSHGLVRDEPPVEEDFWTPLSSRKKKKGKRKSQQYTSGPLVSESQTQIDLNSENLESIDKREDQVVRGLDESENLYEKDILEQIAAESSIPIEDDEWALTGTKKGKKAKGKAKNKKYRTDASNPEPEGLTQSDGAQGSQRSEGNDQSLDNPASPNLDQVRGADDRPTGDYLGDNDAMEISPGEEQREIDLSDNKSPQTNDIKDDFMNIQPMNDESSYEETEPRETTDRLSHDEILNSNISDSNDTKTLGGDSSENELVKTDPSNESGDWSSFSLKKNKKSGKGKGKKSRSQSLASDEVEPKSLKEPTELPKHEKDASYVALIAEPEDIDTPFESDIQSQPAASAELHEPEEEEDDVWAVTTGKKKKKNQKKRQSVTFDDVPTIVDEEPSESAATGSATPLESDTAAQEDEWIGATSKTKKGKKNRQSLMLTDAIETNDTEEQFAPVRSEGGDIEAKDLSAEINPRIEAELVNEPQSMVEDTEWAIQSSQKSKKAKKGKRQSITSDKGLSDADGASPEETSVPSEDIKFDLDTQMAVDSRSVEDIQPLQPTADEEVTSIPTTSRKNGKGKKNRQALLLEDNSEIASNITPVLPEETQPRSNLIEDTFPEKNEDIMKEENGSNATLQAEPERSLQFEPETLMSTEPGTLQTKSETILSNELGTESEAQPEQRVIDEDQTATTPTSASKKGRKNSKKRQSFDSGDVLGDMEIGNLASSETAMQTTEDRQIVPDKPIEAELPATSNVELGSQPETEQPIEDEWSEKPKRKSKKNKKQRQSVNFEDNLDVPDKDTQATPADVALAQDNENTQISDSILEEREVIAEPQPETQLVSQPVERAEVERWEDTQYKKGKGNKRRKSATIGALAAIFESADTAPSSRIESTKPDREYSSKPLEVLDSPSVEQPSQESAGDISEDSAIIHAPGSEQMDNEKDVKEELREEPGQKAPETSADEPRKFIEESQTTPILMPESPRGESTAEGSEDFQRMDIDNEYDKSMNEETENNSKGEDAMILEDTEIQPLAPATVLNEPDASHTLTDAPTTIEKEDKAMDTAKLEPLDPEKKPDDDDWTAPVVTKKSKRKGKNKRQPLDEPEDVIEDTNKPDLKCFPIDTVEQIDSTPLRAKEDRLERLSFSAKDLSDSIAREGSTEFIDDNNDNDKISFQQAKSKKGKKGKKGKRLSSSDAFESESPKPETRDEKIEFSSSFFDAPIVEEPTATEEPSLIRKESNQRESEQIFSQQDIGEPADRREEPGFLDTIQPTDELGLQDAIPADDDGEFFTTKKSKKKGKRAKAAALGAAALGVIGIGVSKENDKPVQVEDSMKDAKTASENSQSPWSKPYRILESTNDGPRDLESSGSAREIPLPSFDEDIESTDFTVGEITLNNEAIGDKDHDQKHELGERSEVEIEETGSTSTLQKHSYRTEEDSREEPAFTQEYMQPLYEAELIEHETHEDELRARRDSTRAEASPTRSQDDGKGQTQKLTSIEDTWENESATNDIDMHDRPSDSREQLSEIGQQILQEPHNVETPVHKDDSFESLVAASLQNSGFDPTLARALSPDQRAALLDSTEADRVENSWTESHTLRTQRRRHSISDSSNEDFGPAVHRERAALSSDDESDIRHKRTDADFDEIVNSGLITAGFDAGTLEKATEVSGEDGDNDLAHVIRRSPSPNAPSQLWSQASSSPAKGLSRQGSVEDVTESKGSSDVSSSSRRRRRDRRKGSAAAQAASVGLIGAGAMALESSQRKARRLGELPGDLRRQNTEDWEHSLESTEEGNSEAVPGRQMFDYSDGQDEPARQPINRDSGYQGSVPETPVFIQELEDIEEGHSSKPIDFFDPRIPMVNQTTIMEEDSQSQTRGTVDEDYPLPSVPAEDEDEEDPSQVDPSSKVRTSYLFRGASSSPRDVRSSPAQARSQHPSPATGQALSQRELEERLSRSRSASPDDNEEPMDTDSPSIQRQISRTRPLESIVERSPESSPVRQPTRMALDETIISDSSNSATSIVTRQASAPAQTISRSIIEEEDEEAVGPPKSITSSLLEQQERGEAPPNRPEIANTRRAYMRSVSSESNLAGQEIRPPSALSARSNAQSPVQYPPPRTSSAQSFHSRTPSAMSNRSAGSSLRRTDRSTSDLRASNRRAEALAGDAVAAAAVDKELKNKNNGSAERFQSYDPLKGSGKERRSDMSENNVYEGWGDVPDSPRSPSKPPSLRKRQSLHVLDLENRLEQMRQENQSLLDTHVRKQAEIEASVQEHQEANRSLTESLAARDFKMREKDVEIQTIRGSLELLQQEAARLTAVNEKLSEQNRGMSLGGEYATLQAEHDKAQEQWRDSSRQLEDLQRKHTELNAGMEEEINKGLQDKDIEIAELRTQLSRATDKIRSLQGQLLATRRGDDYLNVRDEVYFDSACQQLCQHVQQWVLRFSKYSDTRVCRISAELHNEPLETRLDNAILDGTDVDIYLKNRVERRDVFMSVVMTMIWEFIFTRYLFGMDREQRQRLKALEKILSEVGPSKAVAQWRSITLSLLARRQAFADQRAEDTEAVVQEIYTNLSQLLPPPSNVRQQIKDSLRNVLKLAVDLSIEMRTQRAEYIMCPPLKPEYDSNGDLARKVYFNASLMNERSGNFSSNDELESKQASVRLVLFPLVLKKGNEQGESDDELVVCPAQVLVSTPPKTRVSRMKSGPMSMAAENKSVQSVAPSVMDTDDNIV